MIAFGNCTIFIAVTHLWSQVSFGLETSGFGSFHLHSESPPPTITNPRFDKVPCLPSHLERVLICRKKGTICLALRYLLFHFPGSWILVILFGVREELAKCPEKQLFLRNKLGRKTINPPVPPLRKTNGRPMCSKADVFTKRPTLSLRTHFPVSEGPVDFLKLGTCVL